MSDLPKRGDRVRVTEKLSGSFLQVGDAITLIEDARPCPNWGEGACVCIYEGRNGNGFGRTWSGPVKVEILERAHASKVEIIERDGYKFTLTCRKCGLAMKLEAGPLKRHDTTIDTCALCDEKSAEFARGMRRAVEIAERLCARDDAFYHLANELKEAVEKELKP